MISGPAGSGSFTIVRLTSEDAAEAAQLEAVCFSPAWQEETIGSYLENPLCRGWGLKIGDDLAGSLLARIVAGEGEVLRICVRPDCRARGYGRQLLNTLFAESPEAEAWYLEVREGNAPALALYRGAGFVQSGRRKQYYPESGEDALLMRRGAGEKYDA